MYIRSGDVGTLFPARQAFQAGKAGKDGLTCVTKRASRRRLGVWVGGGTRQCLALFPELGAVVSQRGNNWMESVGLIRVHRAV